MLSTIDHPDRKASDMTHGQLSMDAPHWTATWRWECVSICISKYKQRTESEQLHTCTCTANAFIPFDDTALESLVRKKDLLPKQFRVDHVT